MRGSIFASIAALAAFGVPGRVRPDRRGGLDRNNAELSRLGNHMLRDIGLIRDPDVMHRHHLMRW